MIRRRRRKLHTPPAPPPLPPEHWETRIEPTHPIGWEVTLLSNYTIARGVWWRPSLTWAERTANRVLTRHLNRLARLRERQDRANNRPDPTRRTL